MTFHEILDWLDAHELMTVRVALEREAHIEADALRALVGRGTSRSLSRWAACLKESQIFYAEELTEYLKLRPDVALTPEDILMYRRRPVVWAVATLMILAGYGKEK